MKEFTYTLTIQPGLNARPAAELVTLCNRFSSKIELHTEYRSLPATALMSIIALGLRTGDSFRITAEGNDEEQAIAELEVFCEERL